MSTERSEQSDRSHKTRGAEREKCIEPPAPLTQLLPIVLRLVKRLDITTTKGRKKRDTMDYTDVSQVSNKCDEIYGLLSNPQKFLITAPSSHDDSQEVNEQRNELCQVLQYMFGYLEFLAGLSANEQQPIMNSNKGKNRRNTSNAQYLSEAPLSGITELFVGETTKDTNGGQRNIQPIDVETIWGQVDIQNQALLRRLKKSVKKMSEGAETYFNSSNQTKESIPKANNNKENEKYLIRLVDFKQLSDDESEGNGGEGLETSDEDNDEEKNYADDDDGDDDDVQQDEDPDSKRIRERMERTMAQMDDNNELSTDDEDKVSEKLVPNLKGQDRSNDGDEEEELEDEAAEVLNDGFFDLHDMEAFADSEEEYHMPADEDDQEEEKVKKNDKKQSQKKYNDTLSSEEEEEENDSADKEEKLVMGFRRKKFRSDEEIDALLSIYNENDHGEDDSEEDAVINMTAADFFGRPSSKYLASRKKAGLRHLHKPAKRENREDLEFDDNDGDSWGEQNLDNDGNDDLGWNAGSSGFDSDATADEEDSVTKDKAKPVQGNNNSELKGDMKQQSLKKLKLEEQTKQLESELLAEKPWAMRGETSGSSRPMNSLLEETPQFEVSSKVAPIITKEHSESIEAVIKQRILAEDWDDVIPRELHSKTAKIEDLPEVSQEKAKLGLGELYERDYLKKTEGYDADAAEKNSVEEKAKNEMRKLFASLCTKLDALSNYNFAPRHVEEEAEVHVITTPAIAMEEVLPLHVSESRAAAPEEVYATAATKKGAVLKGESERDQIDRKRARKAKKTARRKARKAKLADEKFISRLQPASLGLNNPYEKRKLREEFSKARAYGKVMDGTKDKHVDYTTSTKFFKRMQEEVEKSVSVNGDENTSKKRLKMSEVAQKSSAFKL